MKYNILVIIPCYNEEKSIKTTVESLKAAVPDIDYIIINDGSSDNTYQVCCQNNYHVINLPFNLGLSNAVQTGMRYANAKGYDMALQFDGDGQHLPEYIDKLINKMIESDADIVIGSRYAEKSSHSLRGLGGILLRIAVKITTGKSLTDPTSGMRLFNRLMIERFANKMNHGPEPDTLAYLMNQNVKIEESPVVMQERKAGKSYLSALAALNYMLCMSVSIIIIQWFRGKELKD